MKILKPAAMAAILRVFERAGNEVHPVHEHTALCVHASFADDKRSFYDLGHDVVLEIDNVAIFLQSTQTDLRIELIPVGTLEHEAWIVKTPEEWATLNDTLLADDEFEHVDKEWRLPHLLAKMFRHKPTGGVMQIVWRKEQVYEGLFDK